MILQHDLIDYKAHPLLVIAIYCHHPFPSHTGEVVYSFLNLRNYYRRGHALESTVGSGTPHL